MAHFAKLDNDNKIIQVIVVDNKDILDENGKEREEVGINYLHNLYQHHAWKQTSYNESFRKNYAGIGYTYDSKTDSFIPPQPYPSWTLNQTTAQWESPIEHPSDGIERKWDEEKQEWRPFNEFI